MKHRIEDDPIARNLLLISRQKLTEYKKEILSQIEKLEHASDEEADADYEDIRRRYLDSVYDEIYSQMEKYEDAQERLRSYRLSEDGKNGMMAGSLYAAIYPSLTGKEASLDDCITLNHAQNALMDQVLDEIESGESSHSALPMRSGRFTKGSPHRSKIDSSLKAAIVIVSFLLVISLAVVTWIQNFNLTKEYDDLSQSYDDLSQSYDDVVDILDHNLDLEFANDNAFYYHKYSCYLFDKSEHAYYGSAEDMEAAGYSECQFCH